MEGCAYHLQKKDEAHERVVKHVLFIKYLITDTIEGTSNTRALLDLQPDLPLVFDLARLVVSYDSPDDATFDLTEAPKETSISWTVLEYVGVEQCCSLCRNAFELVQDGPWNYRPDVSGKYERLGSLLFRPVTQSFVHGADLSLHKFHSRKGPPPGADVKAASWKLFRRYCTDYEAAYDELSPSCTFIDTVKEGDRMCDACCDILGARNEVLDRWRRRSYNDDF